MSDEVNVLQGKINDYRPNEIVAYRECILGIMFLLFVGVLFGSLVLIIGLTLDAHSRMQRATYQKTLNETKRKH